MQVHQPRRNAGGYLAALGIFYLIAGLSLTQIITNLHFADDWEYLLIGYYNSLIDSVLGAFFRHLRLGRDLYMVAAVKLFGVDRTILHVVAMLWHVAAGVLFGFCLLRAFPARPGLAVASTATALALPVLASYTYTMMADQSRVSAFLVLLSIYLCQTWVIRGYAIRWLVASAASYVASLTVYEGGLLLVLVIPLFVLPIIARRREGRDDNDLWKRAWHFTATFAGAGIVIAVYRYVLGFGGWQNPGPTLPPADAAIGSLGMASTYLVTPIRELSGEPVAAAFGAGAALLTGWILLVAPGRDAGRTSPLDDFPQSGLYVFLTGAALYVLSLVPFLLTVLAGGAFANPGWHHDLRAFSPSAYGLAMLIGWLASSIDRRFIAVPLKIVLAGFIGVWTAFWFELRLDWQEAADIHCRLWTSLLRQAPYVSGGTTILFDDFVQYHRRAFVGFRGQSNLMALAQMLYRTPGVGEQIYTFPLPRLPAQGRLAEEHDATVTPKGIVVHGSGYFVEGGAIALDRLLLVSLQGGELVVLDRIAAESQTFAIRWDGVSELRSNRELIRMPSATDPSIRERLERLSIRCD